MCIDVCYARATAAANAPFCANDDHCATKMERAAARHHKLYIKRSELARASGARDWTWGKRVESVKPHHAARVAARTCLARNTIEAQEDMPSIVFMGANKGKRRKPSIANVVGSARNCGVACDEVTHAVLSSTQAHDTANGLTEQDCDEVTGEVTDEAGTEQVPTASPEEAPREVPPKALEALPKPVASESSDPASQKAGCAIS